MNNEIIELLRTVIKEELAGLKQDVAGLKQDVAEIKVEQQKMNDRLTILESRQQKIYEQTGELLEFRNEAMARFNQLATN